MKISSVRYTAKISLPNYESTGIELEYPLETDGDTVDKAREDFMGRAKEFAKLIGAKSDSRFLK